MYTILEQDELSVSDSIVFKSENVVIPQSKMIRYIHASHLGVEKCEHLAKNVLFWAGMTSQIENTILNCKVCSTCQWKNTKELMLTHTIPEHPWAK